ncbi:glycerophosphodiester phosphodiesterase family protein [Sinimarinibacterium flocculans]|uniref:glycerophosphodiester phosphodiesterase family protein n=1 Tax=Sinimarinibacterium flocculans TaxID=985250 RepID=UPI0035130195
MRTRRKVRGLLSAVVALCAVWAPGFATAGGDHGQAGTAVELGPRPFHLVEDMDDSPLKRRLQQCAKRPSRRSDFSIAHRGAPLQFPEHTRESYEAAIRMGAGIVECDVTFTADRELVCRHSQCDLHTTTDILARSDLAAKCSAPFVPAEFDPATGERTRAASAHCCTSDITLAEFRTLCGKMDAANPDATSVAQYLDGTARWRTDLYAGCGTLMTHAESIALFRRHGVKMTPELKEPSVPMPYQGDYTQQQYAQQMIDEYRAAGVRPREVFPQSFRIEDVRYWIEHEPLFGRQAVYLDGRVDDPAFVATLEDFQALAAQGVRIVAPPMWALVTLDESQRIVPSGYARLARLAGLDIIAWSFERSGPIADMVAEGRQYYFQSVAEVMDNDGDAIEVLDVLAREVGIIGIFSDWPATVTHYANCMRL